VSDLQDLYREVIVDHGQRPRNKRRIERDDVRSHAGYNPLCGDSVTVHVAVGADGRVEDVAFEGEGCAISQASASMMTEAVAGRSLEEVEALIVGFQHLVTVGDAGVDGADAGRAGQDGETGAGSAPSTDDTDLGSLLALGGVRAYPMRVKCATLAWHALRAALADDGQDGGRDERA